MCYSLDVSRNSFFINMFSCLILYNYNSTNKNSKILSLFFLFVGLMQLYDWIFWSNQDITHTKQMAVNYFFTKMAMISNHLQPIVLATLLLYYNKSLKNLSIFFVILYSLFMYYYTSNIYNSIDYTLKHKINVHNTQRVSLEWKWNEGSDNFIVYSVYLMTLGVLSYQNFKTPLNIILVLINFLSFFLFNNGSDIGRFWCNYSSYISVILLVSEYFTGIISQNYI